MHQKGDAEEFLATLLGLLSRGAIFGGNGNRGVGLAVVDGDYAYRPYDLSSLEDYAAYLDDDRAVRQGDTPGGTARLPQMAAKLDTLRVEFTLAVPPGQDILIGDGQGLEAQAQPQRVKAADGRDYWRLPGASLRGCSADASSTMNAAPFAWMNARSPSQSLSSSSMRASTSWLNRCD